MRAITIAASEGALIGTAEVDWYADTYPALIPWLHRRRGAARPFAWKDATNPFGTIDILAPLRQDHYPL